MKDRNKFMSKYCSYQKQLWQYKTKFNNVFGIEIYKLERYFQLSNFIKNNTVVVLSASHI